jgi:uncharacterized membrane protein
MDANTLSMIILIVTGVLMWTPNIVYVAWVVPLVFFFMEKESKFVKLQACTALVFGVISAALEIVFRIIIWMLTPRTTAQVINYISRGGWGLYTLFSWLLAILGVALTLLLVYIIMSAYNYKQVELPIIGPIAAKASEKLSGVNINLPTNTNTNTPTESTVKPIFCGECGAKNESGTKFCGSCGKPL